MKCEICKEKIEELYLAKIAGTIIKDENGKKHYVCNHCQKRLENDKTKILENIN